MIDEKQEEAEQAAPEDVPGAPADGEEPTDAEGLRARLDEEKKRAQGYLANWQRAAADYQNFKRRVEGERSEVARLASASLVINLLPLLDDLERALHTVDSKLAGLTWIDGIWLVYRKFQAMLENAGVKEIPADSEQFDPQVHEAISQAPGDEGKILSVVQRGYKLGERVIRPAMVVVGKKEQGTGTQEGEGGDGAAEEEKREQSSGSDGD